MTRCRTAIWSEFTQVRVTSAVAIMLRVCFLSIATLILTCSGSGWQQPPIPQSAPQPKPATVSAVLGGNASLPCDFSALQLGDSDDQLRVIWMRNSLTLTFNRNSLLDSRISVSQPPAHAGSPLRNFDLSIAGLRLADQGLYSCVASSGGGYHVRRVELMVKVPPRIRAADSSPLKVVVVEGRPLSLRCSAYGSPPPSIAWFKRISGRSLTPGGGRRTVPLGTGPVYTVASASRQCDGIFQCQADNGEKPVDTREIRVIVHYRPRVSVANEQISQSRGHSTMVMCAVSGLPIPELYWEHRGRQFRPGPEAATCWSGGRHCLYLQATNADGEADGGVQTMSRMDLLVRNLTAGDFGVYECVARSELGEDRKAAHVLELQDPNRGPQQQAKDSAAEAARPPYYASSASASSASRSAASQPAAGSGSAEAIDAAGARINKHSSGSLVTSSAGSTAAAAAAASTSSMFALATAARWLADWPRP